MEQRKHAATEGRRHRLAALGRGATLAMLLAQHGAAHGAEVASLSARDLQLVVRAVGFMQPPPRGGVAAVLYAAGNAGSKQDADAIAGEFGSGLPMPSGTLRAEAVDLPTLARGGFALVVAAEGASNAALGDAVRASHVLCVTADQAAVEAGYCTMAIRAEPHVEITLNHATAAASGISFVVAFRMMIRER